jgi:vitamin B12 transporter
MKTSFPVMRLAALPLALAAALPAFPQTPVPDQIVAQASERRLGDTVITATRTATRVDELVSDVVVIERKAIEASTARSLSELIARNAGVQMSANGGLGKNSSLFIRGTESRHTVLLIDGVRFGSATAGLPSLDNIPVDMIERIEVLKGPASALYGSEAVGGVVQIFTRQGQKGFYPYASATVGSESYRQLAAGASGGDGAVSYALGLQKTREKGFSSTNPNVQFGNFNPDRDGFDQDAISGSFSYKFNNDWSLNSTLLVSAADVQLDDGPGRNALTAVDAQVFSLGLKGKVLADWQTELRFGTSADKSVSVVSGTPGRFNTRQNQVEWQNNISTSIGLVLLGLDHRVQKVDSTTAYPVTERSISSVFAGLTGSQGNHSWQVNLRRDHNSQFGDASTYFAGYGYRLTPAWRLNISQGTSFVAPSYNQLYFPNFGNPSLLPERGRNVDIGVAYTEGAHQVKLVHFDNKIRGFITNTTLPQNIPRARIEGWTLSHDGSFGKLQTRASLDLLDPRNEQNGRQLPRRSEQQLTLGADYDFGLWRLGATLLHVGDRFDDANNTPSRALPAFSTLDLNAEYPLSKEWKLQGKINNLTDRKYETAYGYNQAGRSVFLTLKYTPR